RPGGADPGARARGRPPRRTLVGDAQRRRAERPVPRRARPRRDRDPDRRPCRGAVVRARRTDLAVVRCRRAAYSGGPNLVDDGFRGTRPYLAIGGYGDSPRAGAS